MATATDAPETPADTGIPDPVLELTAEAPERATVKFVSKEEEPSVEARQKIRALRRQEAAIIREVETEIATREDEDKQGASEKDMRKRLSAIRKQREDLEPDGKLYELMSLEDYGIQEQQRLTREGAVFDKLWNTDDLNSSQRARLATLLEHMFEKAIDAPKEIKAQFSDGQKSQVVLAFSIAPLAAQAARQRQRDDDLI